MSTLVSHPLPTSPSQSAPSRGQLVIAQLPSTHSAVEVVSRESHQRVPSLLSVVPASQSESRPSQTSTAPGKTDARVSSQSPTGSWPEYTLA